MTNASEILRRRVYVLMIVVAAAGIAGRVLSVARVVEPALSRPDPGRAARAILLPFASDNALEALALTGAGWDTWGGLDPDEHRGVWSRTRPEPMPTLGDNDRSRWDTVRALVDQGTYAIGYRDSLPHTGPKTGAILLPLASSNGLELLNLTAASQTTLDQLQATGDYFDHGIVTEDGWRTIDKVLRPEAPGQTRNFYSSKPPLLVTLLAGEYWLLKKTFGWSITEQRWWVVRIILFTVNWLPFVIYLALLARLVDRLGFTDWGRLFVVAAACFATFLTTFATTLNNHTLAACCALFALYPALKILEEDKVTKNVPPDGEVSGRLLSPCHLVTLSPCHFLLAGFFAGFTACTELPAASFAAALGLLLLWKAPGRTLAFFVPAAAVPVAGFFLTNYLAIGQLKPAYSEFGGPWYEYPGTFWLGQPGKPHYGIDWAREKESRVVYGFHLVLGHHGFFSLTPIFLLGLGSILYGLWHCKRYVRSFARGSALPVILSLTTANTVVVLGFYIGIVSSRNYGGWTSGPRWLFWLTPFWLLSMVPAADWLSQRRWGRCLAYGLFALSMISVTYPAWNPWRHPWIYDFMEARGWLPY
ncbi:MAG: hypothetical protein JO112_04215 [Planctomycetes bacterium]|nr:hypothetical protein [Planctomycetota bacterium]